VAAWREAPLRSAYLAFPHLAAGQRIQHWPPPSLSFSHISNLGVKLLLREHDFPTNGAYGGIRNHEKSFIPGSADFCPLFMKLIANWVSIA